MINLSIHGTQVYLIIHLYVDKASLKCIYIQIHPKGMFNQP